MIIKGAQKANLKVALMGGHKEHPGSNKWGINICDLLQREGLNPDLTYFQQKPGVPEGLQFPKTPAGVKEEMKYKFAGGQLNPATGLFEFFKAPWGRLENLQDEHYKIWELTIASKVDQYVKNGGAIELVEHYIVHLQDEEHPLTIKFV